MIFTRLPTISTKIFIHVSVQISKLCLMLLVVKLCVDFHPVKASGPRLRQTGFLSPAHVPVEIRRASFLLLLRDINSASKCTGLIGHISTTVVSSGIAKFPCGWK